MAKLFFEVFSSYLVLAETANLIFFKISQMTSKTMFSTLTKFD